MFIQLTKKISQKDAERLRKARQEILSKSSFMNFKYLFEAANTKQSPPETQPKDYNFNTVNVIEETVIGKYIPSKFIIGVENEIIDCSRIDEREKTKFPKGLIFSLQLLNTNNFSYNYRDFLMKISGKKPFSDELFFDGYNSYDNFTDNKLNDFFNYFRDKDKIYRRIYRLLVVNKEKIEKLISKEFADNIIELFSAKNIKEEIEDFTFFKKKYPKQFFKDNNFALEENKDILLSKFYIPKEFVATVAVLYLSEDNLLKIYFNIDDYFIRRKKALKNIKNRHSLEISLRREKVFEKFLCENLNDWLKSIVSLAAFETKIYKKLETKILINQM